MSKKGKGRRTPEQRLARKSVRAEKGAGIFRYLTPAQASSREFAPKQQQIADDVKQVSETMKQHARELDSESQVLSEGESK